MIREVLNNRLREALLSLLINVAKAQEKLLRRKSIQEARGNIIEVRELLKTAERLGVITGSSIKIIYNLLDKLLDDLYAKRKK